MSTGRTQDRYRSASTDRRDKQQNQRNNDHRDHPQKRDDSGRSKSRDGRSQDPAQRGSDAQPDAFRHQHRAPAVSARNSTSAQPLPPPPASTAPVARPAAGVLGAGHRNAFALEAARLLKEKGTLSPAPAAKADEEEEAEDGELPEEPASKKRKHSPIIWSAQPESDGTRRLSRSPQITGSHPASPVSSAPSIVRAEASSPTRGLVQPGTAANRAAAELADFQTRQLDDFDPDGPPAMKDSPSVSGEPDTGAPAGGDVTSAAVTMSLGPGVTVHAEVTTTGGGADAALANVLDAAAAATQPRNKWAAIEEQEAVEANSEEAHMAALNAKERRELKEMADGMPEQMDEDSAQADGSPESDATTAPNMLQQCRKVDNFQRLNCINEGTYGMVYRAKETETGKIFALKKIKMERETEGFPLTSIREINILLALHHKNIVNVTEVVVGRKMDDIFMVMEFMEHDLKGLMESQDSNAGPLFGLSEVKSLMHQLIAGVSYLHDNWVIHRDLKTSNILYNNKGDLKICDFGLARQYGSPLRAYTHMVVTLWYRAPELLLGVREYSTAIDMWSVGCIMGELLQNKALLPGKSELEQINKIFNLVGTPTAENWPTHTELPNMKKFKFGPLPSKLQEKFPIRRFDFDGRSLSDAGFELLEGLLTLDPSRRLTAQQALDHRWFREQPFPKDLPLMPTFPVKQGEGSHHHKARHRQPSPTENKKKLKT